MRIKSHRKLIDIAPNGGAIGALVLVGTHLESIKAAGVPPMIAFLGAFLLGYGIPMILFRFFIHASCPKCQGRSFFLGGSPLKYLCKDCGHVHNTRIHESD